MVGNLLPIITHGLIKQGFTCPCITRNMEVSTVNFGSSPQGLNIPTSFHSSTWPFLHVELLSLGWWPHVCNRVSATPSNTQIKRQERIGEKPASISALLLESKTFQKFLLTNIPLDFIGYYWIICPPKYGGQRYLTWNSESATLLPKNNQFEYKRRREYLDK